MTLQIGDPAPDFQATTGTGETVTLTDYRGRKLVLYFYPMDDTPGCTRQACSLRDHHGEMLARGAAVLGVSTQDRDAHQRFTDKHGLNFPLLVDADRQLARAYGAIGGGLGGLARGTLGMARRITFIIDEQGRIAHIIDRPDTARHGEEVLKLL